MTSTPSVPEPRATPEGDPAFGAVVEHIADYAVFLIDAAGAVRTWNAGAARATGYAASQVIGQPFATLFPPEDRARGAASLMDVASRVGRAEDEGWLVRSGGERFWATTVVTRLAGPNAASRAGAGGFVAILRDLTARLEVREALDRARRAAEAASRAKSEFLATTSHELRTPINAIMGYAELLELGIAGPLTDAQRAYLERLRLSSRHLLGIVTQVLDLSRIEAGRTELAIVPAYAEDAAAAATTLVEPQAQARHVTLVNACRASADVAYVGDPERVDQILVNLLANAVKFTDAGGRVTLTCGTAHRPPPEARIDACPEAWVYFRVEDTGSGIPEDRLEAIFEPFVQAEQSLRRRHEGTGLGLTITRRLARLMGGDVTVRSAPGVGSTFLVWLPAAPADFVVPFAQRRPSERRGPARTARGLATVADVALGEIEHVLGGYVARLRTDPAVPHAHALPEALLEDHAATFLADMAQCLTAVELAAGGPSAELRDGTAIQRLIAERHGAQRARLGWSEAEVRREFVVLGEEVERAVRQRLHGRPDVDLDAAMALMRGFLAHAEEVSVRAHGGRPRTPTTPAVAVLPAAAREADVPSAPHPQGASRSEPR